jgi:chromosome segregation ATPase
MNTISKQLKTTIAMVSACLACAFIALVALFATTGGLDKLGTSVLLGILVAFVAVGSAVIVDEYKSEVHANELRGMSYTLNAVREMRDEYADTLAMVEADNRDGVANLQLNLDNTTDTLARVIAERDALAHSADYSELASALQASQELVTQLTVERDNLRGISEARALKAEQLRKQVAELAERVEVLQESRQDWKSSYYSLHDEYNELTAQLAVANKNKDGYRDLYRALVTEHDELTAELDEYRYTVKAERERIADI